MHVLLEPGFELSQLVLCPFHHLHGCSQIPTAHTVVNQCPHRMAFHLTILKRKQDILNFFLKATLFFFILCLIHYFCPDTRTLILVKNSVCDRSQRSWGLSIGKALHISAVKGMIPSAWPDFSSENSRISMWYPPNPGGGFGLGHQGIKNIFTETKISNWSLISAGKEETARLSCVLFNVIIYYFFI